MKKSRILIICIVFLIACLVFAGPPIQPILNFFLDLEDTPSDYTGDDGKVVKVDEANNQLIFEAESGAVEDDAYGAGWNGDTANAPSQNATYDILHQYDTDDDGDIDNIDGAVGGGDITGVGPGALAAGDALTDGYVTTGTTLFIWEGTTDDGNEFRIIVPEDPGSDIDVTMPTATGTLNAAGDITGTDAGTDLTADLEEEVTEGSLADSTITSAEIKDGEVALVDLATAAYAKDIVATSPVLVDGGTNTDNVLVGADGDVTISVTVAKDIVTTAPLTGAVDNVIIGTDADITLGIDVLKDLVTTAPITGGTNNILPGADADITIAIADADDDGATKGAASFDNTDFDAVAGNVTIVDDGHAHTGTSISSLDISDDTNLTAGDALTLTDDDIDFDGGASPAGDLGGTWGNPSVDNDSHDHTSTTISGLDISADTNLTAGDHITLTDDDLDVDDDFLLNSGDVGTGVYDFGDADSFELPNAAAPTTDATGEIALDITITDHQPLHQYYDGGENMTIIAIDTAQLPALDNEIIKYDAGADKFVLEADAGGGGGNDVYIEEGDVAKVDSSGADLYIDFDGTNFDVGVVGNEGNVTLAADGIDSVHYAPGSIDQEHFAVDVIGADEYADGDLGDTSFSGGASTVESMTVNNATTGTYYLGMYDTDTGSNLVVYTDGALSFAQATGTLSSTEFSGGGASLTSIDAATGDSATGFFDAGTIEHEYGGLEADVSGYSGLVAIEGGSTGEIDAKSELEGQIADVADFAEADGDTWTGTHDLSGATVTMPKRTKNDDRFYVFNLFNPNSLYDTDTQVCFEPNLPANITITEVQISCDADPATELDIDLKFADAFIGLANATLIEPIDTTNGTTDIDSGFDDATVAAGKCMYVEFAADPDSNIKQAIVKIRYDFD